PMLAIAKAGAVLLSFNMRTADGPMADIEALAADFASGKILDITPFGGFAYGDSPAAGAAVSVTADGERAESLAKEMASEMYARRERFAVALPSPEKALRSLRY